MFVYFIFVGKQLVLKTSDRDQAAKSWRDYALAGENVHMVRKFSRE